MHEKKFYQFSRVERLASLNLSDSSRKILEQTSLSEDIAGNLTENQISEVEIPMGLCFISLDGHDFKVPMATEEPSVIAAANNGSKLAGEFKTIKNNRLMSGQIVFYDVVSPESLKMAIEARTTEIFSVADNAYPSIIKRGGGLQSFEIITRQTEDTIFLTVDFIFDTKDAQGANIINTILEAISEKFRSDFPNEKILFSILSNLLEYCQTEIQCEIPINKIGPEVAKKISLASLYAAEDWSRSATHNKGIMNGIEAVALATGNDTRSINASVYATRPHPFAKWWIEDTKLIGVIDVSLPIATAGGGTHVLPKAQVAHELLGNPNAKQLASITAAVGLANNLAAIKALVTKGIQSGHMALQARSLALSVGASGEEIEKLTIALKKTEHMNSETAKSLLYELRDPTV
ncbi:hydroxymethylglutaryl-CoA reductase [Lactovum miscens]|uniref:Hydroxymethylglutaryl-CoA reductase n=1 Tax=Lactovum miscens TaxID=190387 RepID=A0A841C7A0_9LACT|nr:hydroxymethylglutaryl-CoA reductase [Lactovum miscens]MBB5888355.1 hydroxymethylglutaryl-CoA reductase [Lactovum miscens]